MTSPPMMLSSRVPSALSACLLGWFCMLSGGRAQDFTLQLVQGDQVFSEGILPGAILDFIDPLKEGYKGEFRFQIQGTLGYNSNLFIDSYNPQDDVVLGITPSMIYITDPEGGAPFALTAYYRPTAMFYLDHSDLNRVNHSAGAEFKMTGGRTSVRMFVDYLQNSGGDRFTGGFSDSSVLRFGIDGFREIAPRTTLTARLMYSTSNYSGATDFGGVIAVPYRRQPDGADFYSAEIGAMWAATERFGLGSSLRYSASDSSGSGTRTSIATLVNARYQWTERIDLRGSIGPSFYEDSRLGGASGMNLAVQFHARYRFDELWSMKAGIRYDTVPSPSTRNYVVSDYAFVASVTRKLNYGTLEGGASYNFSDYQSSGLTPVDRQAENFWTAFLRYHRSLTASGRLRFNAGLLYASNHGQKDWTQWQFSSGLSVFF